MHLGGVREEEEHSVIPKDDGSLNYEPQRVGYYLGIQKMVRTNDHAPSTQHPKREVLDHLPTEDQGEDRRKEGS